MIKKEGLFSNGGMTQSERSLHTPGSFARQNLLYVQEVGRLQSLSPHRCIRENLDSFLFMVILKGQGKLEVRGKTYVLEKGSCALIDCMEHYEHISDAKDGWKLAWVHFNGHAAKGYYELFMKYNANGHTFKVNDITEWNKIVGTILEKQKDRNLHAELACGEILLNLLNRIVDSVANFSMLEKEKEKQIANELREKLNEHYADSEVLQTVQKTFEEEPKELNRIFQHHFGISIEEYISNRRLNAAKELLRFSIKPVEIIAKEAGIGDMIVLQQMFRENEGMTAEEYRAKWAQWIR